MHPVHSHALHVVFTSDSGHTNQGHQSLTQWSNCQTEGHRQDECSRTRHAHYCLLVSTKPHKMFCPRADIENLLSLATCTHRQNAETQHQHNMIYESEQTHMPHTWSHVSSWEVDAKGNMSHTKQRLLMSHHDQRDAKQFDDDKKDAQTTPHHD